MMHFLKNYHIIGNISEGTPNTRLASGVNFRIVTLSGTAFKLSVGITA